MITFSTIWVRLQEFPTKYYVTHILQKIENKIGTVLKSTVVRHTQHGEGMQDYTS